MNEHALIVLTGARQDVSLQSFLLYSPLLPAATDCRYRQMASSSSSVIFPKRSHGIHAGLTHSRRLLLSNGDTDVIAWTELLKGDHLQAALFHQ